MSELLRIAAVQAVSRNGELEGNLRRASVLVERAATSGAELVVCPEFLATGYAFDPAIWEAATVSAPSAPAAMPTFP
jgi:N-carbamoylputrescine amidase